jgi:hypothetical protein
MNSMAIAIAVGYGLAALSILGRRQLREPWLIAAIAGGAIAFPIALLLATPIQQLFASIFGWDMGAYTTNLGVGLVGVITSAVVNQILKLSPALLIWSFSGERGDALAFGAASGAGFAIVGAYQVIFLALMARALPIGSQGGFEVSLAHQFAFVLTSVATTALAAYGTTRKNIGPYLALAIAGDSLFNTLGLLFTLRLYTNVVWTALSIGVALALLGYAFALSLRSSASGPPPAVS